MTVVPGEIRDKNMPFSSYNEAPMRSANRNGCAESPVAPEEIIRTMDQVHGLDISGFDPSFLVRTLERRLQATGSVSAENYLAERLVKDRLEAEAFHRSLRVGYSAFFRNPLTFALLETQVLPDLVEKGRKTGRSGLRVWSAGCAAGQEAWSLAMLLDELAASTELQPAWRVFGTDLSETDLALARAGVYSAAELGNVRLRHLDACFTRQGDGFAVAARLRERVEFAVYDLLDTANSCPPISIFGEFDLVLCCNVLIYYRPAQQRRILDKILGCLAPGGYLVTGETERRIAGIVANLREATSPASVFQTTKR
jgi:chemotaxis methyl-accepting protein methylase